MTKPKSDTAFLGHPSGLGWLAGSEFFERFSYYGMQTLLVLYMTHYLLVGDHSSHVLGFDLFHRFLNFLNGRELSGTALASATYGFYGSFVYITPLLGGLLADRLTGRTAAVTLGALLMVLGHFLMAFDVSFVFALLCLLVGVGCFKGNIAAQVGDLYAPSDLRRADAFQIYYLGIQLAGMIAPIVCSTLGEKYAWHWGFGAAGIGMLVGLLLYLRGRPAFPKEKFRRGGEIKRPPLTARDIRALVVLAVMVPVLAMALLGNMQIFGAYLLWAEKSFHLVFFGQTMPVGWMVSLDGIISFATMAGSVMFWRWYGTVRKEPDEVTKMTIGICIASCAPLLLAAASMIVARTGQPVSLGWAVAFHVINDIGFGNILPIMLALYSRCAPKGWESVMVALSYLALALAVYLAGNLGGLLGTMPDSQFWLMHVGIMLASAAIIVTLRTFTGRILAPA
ncbi:MAG: amino acid transporter [Alphaproteobacteria bacterium]|nr:amino acid transporter [Alphaproteobacteria bacterium]